MKKKLAMLSVVLPLGLFALLAACGGDNVEGDVNTDLDELVALEADLEVDKHVDVEETVQMQAAVSYGDEDVADADDVVFEVWEEGHEDDSDMIDATNNDDGSYSAETSFAEDGLYHVQVHVTARDMHTMPEKEIIVGEGGDYDDVAADVDDVDDVDAFETDGFDMAFTEPDRIEAGEDVTLTTTISIDDEPFEEAQVRYEIWNYEISDRHAWAEAEETEPGDYESTYAFPEEGTFHIQIHVEDDEGLHEQSEVQVNVE